MKEYNIDEIESNLESLKDLSEELKIELGKRQSHYAELSGISRQAISQFIFGRWNFKPDKLFHLYKVVQKDHEQYK